MNKQEFIEKLKMHGAWCTECHDINGKKDIYVKSAKVRELLEQLDELQVEKVEVPGFIDKLIRKCKAKKETIFCSIANLYRESDEYKWYVDNAEIYERAWVNGYTVKPKRWVVKAGDYHSTYVDSLTITSEKSRHTISGKEKAHIFTDRAKAEAVAVLVEGTVVEID